MRRNCKEIYPPKNINDEKSEMFKHSNIASENLFQN